MNLRKPLFLAVVLTGSAVAGPSGSSGGFDPCATFFWSGSHHEPVERYQPHYLIGLGLEDVGMDHIFGSRIRHEWSQQAATCFASANRYGYFSHPRFEEFPARGRKFSEKLQDIRLVVEQLSLTSSDPIYQDSLLRAKASSYGVIGAMSEGTTAMVSFYDRLVSDYASLIERLSFLLDESIPLPVRTAALDSFCSPANIAGVQAIENQCMAIDHFCEMKAAYDTVQNCAEYRAGATLVDLLAAIADNRDDFREERNVVAAEGATIARLWAEIQSFAD